MDELAVKFGGMDGQSAFMFASEPPLVRLEDSLYSQWEVTLDMLPSLLLASQIRPYIDNHFPEIAIKKETLKDRRQVARIFLIMSFLVHGYVRGGLHQPTVDTIPRKLAVPFKQTVEILGCTPVVNYSSTVLFNWALIDQGKPATLDNLRCLNTITGSPDEAWFYLVAVAMEATGGDIINTALKMQDSVDNDETCALTAILFNFASLIHNLEVILERMYENNLPQAFYKRVRPYLSGWTNDPNLPEGLHYGPGNAGEMYHGASAAQSPLIQAIDIVLGIDHPTQPHDQHDKETASKSRVGMPGVYLKEMRKYMIKSHRDCLLYLTERMTVRHYVESSDSHDLKEAYNAALQSLQSFRSSHIRMVTFYVVAQAAKENKEIQGTGGSNPIPFLKDIREHVDHSKITS